MLLRLADNGHPTVRRRAHLLHSPQSALWSAQPSAVFHPSAEPEAMDVVAARTELVRRYLGAFGPASRADFADCLIGVPNRRAGCSTTYSFDQRAAATADFSLVP